MRDARPDSPVPLCDSSIVVVPTAFPTKKQIATNAIQPMIARQGCGPLQRPILWARLCGFELGRSLRRSYGQAVPASSLSRRIRLTPLVEAPWSSRRRPAAARQGAGDDDAGDDVHGAQQELLQAGDVEPGDQGGSRGSAPSAACWSGCIAPTPAACSGPRSSPPPCPGAGAPNLP